MFLFAGLEVGGEAARATFVTFLTQPGEDGAGFEWKFWRLGTLGLGSVSGFSLSLSPRGRYLLELLIPRHGRDPKLLWLLNWGPRASGPWCSPLSPRGPLSPGQGSPRAVPEPATCEDSERLSAVADVTWKAHRSKYLKIRLYKATFWPINHPPCSSRCRCCALCCLLFPLLSRAAIQPGVLSDGVFLLFFPQPWCFILCIYLFIGVIVLLSTERDGK